MSQAFTKNQAKPSQKKQMAILAVLGVVLLGVVAHYYMNQPQTASADSGNSGGTDGVALVPDKQPSDAIKELAMDPTRDLLRVSIRTWAQNLTWPQPIPLPWMPNGAPC